VVAIARRILGERRVGHAGTLDPFATGLLLLLTGRATRLARYVPDEPKEYEATVRFGAETATEDLHGAVVREAPLPSRAALEAVLVTFRGDIEQVPPAYSAKHVEGKRAYELARAGLDVALAPVAVHVHSMELTSFVGSGDAVAQCRMLVSCGGGTYVRSLARDVARAAGSAAHLVALRRLRTGAFGLDRAVTLEALQAGDAAVAPALDALAGFPQQALTEEETAAVARGVDVEARVGGEHVALVRVTGTGPVLVALGERRVQRSAPGKAGDVSPPGQGDRFQPRVVMRKPPERDAGA